MFMSHHLIEGDYCCVLGIFERQFKSGEPLTIIIDGEQRRDFTHVDDIVDGLIKCGESINKVSGEIFELGNSNNYSINELVDAFNDYPRQYIEARPNEMRETLNTDTNKRTLGWKPSGNIIKFIKDNYING